MMLSVAGMSLILLHSAAAFCGSFVMLHGAMQQVQDVCRLNTNFHGLRAKPVRAAALVMNVPVRAAALVMNAAGVPRSGEDSIGLELMDRLVKALSEVKTMLMGMPESERISRKRTKFGDMAANAASSSSLACSIYFSAIKNSNQYCDRRLRRKHIGFGVAEVAHSREKQKASKNHHVQRAGDVLTALRAYAPRQHESSATVVASSVHDAVSVTLHSMGIHNRVDSTKHEGHTYMDVVIEMADAHHDNFHGVVLQMVGDQTERKSYLVLKAQALVQEGWVVLQVKMSRWDKRSEAQRLEYLACKLATCGFWSRHHALPHHDARNKLTSTQVKQACSQQVQTPSAHRDESSKVKGGS